MHEILTEEAKKSGLAQLEGKPFVIYAEGKRRVIGIIEAARISDDRQALMATVKITDEVAAGVLGAAQDRVEARVA